MCWPHVYRNLTPRLKHMKSLDANLAKNVLADIEDLQWSSLNQKVLLHSYKLLEEKYLFDDKLQHTDAVEEFFAYFRKVWVNIEENNWFKQPTHLLQAIIGALRVRIKRSKQHILFGRGCH